MKNPLQVKDYYSGDPDENPQETTAPATGGEPSGATSSNRITFSPDDIPASGSTATGNTSANPGNGNPGTPADDTRKKRHGCRKFLIWFVTLAIVALGLTFYLRYFNPYVTDARLTGQVLSVEKRGLIFKTFEAEMVTRDALTDTTRVYTRECSMTVADDALARRLQALQCTGRTVTISYERFYGTLPWRGGSNSVITGIVSE